MSTAQPNRTGRRTEASKLAAEAERLLRTEAFVTVPVLARVLNMSPNLVYRGVKDGTVPSVKVGSKIRIPTKSYREMLPPEPTNLAEVV